MKSLPAILFLLAAAALAAILLLYSRLPQPAATSAISPALTLQTSPASLDEAASLPNDTNAPIALTTDNPAREVDPAQAADERAAELMSIAMTEPPGARDTLLSELQNTNRLIRSAAVDALVQLGDRSAAPRLREQAAQTADPDEKSDLVAAADYLELPALTDFAGARQTQAFQQSAGTNRPAGPARHGSRTLHMPAPAGSP
ncbi:MAG: HEAT repeat domain-containing protein [Verrucomicrobiota bacterium]